MKRIWSVGFLITLVVLGGAALAQVFRFQNSGRLNFLFDKAQGQIRLADVVGFYPLAVFMDKINNPGEKRTHARELRGGLEYYVVAVGEGGGGIKDVDIEVFNEIGERVQRDASTSNVAVLQFFVPYTQTYKFRVSEAGMGSYDDGFYSLMVSARKP